MRQAAQLDKQNIFNNIRVVLCQTSHPGNIGSAARAMKTMGLSRLYLVNPKHFPDEQANALAVNAADVLAISGNNPTNGTTNSSWTGYLASGSVIHPHGNSSANTGSTPSQFTIVRVS